MTRVSRFLSDTFDLQLPERIQPWRRSFWAELNPDTGKRVLKIVALVYGAYVLLMLTAGIAVGIALKAGGLA